MRLLHSEGWIETTPALRLRVYNDTEWDAQALIIVNRRKWLIAKETLAFFPLTTSSARIIGQFREGETCDAVLSSGWPKIIRGRQSGATWVADGWEDRLQILDHPPSGN